MARSDRSDRPDTTATRQRLLTALVAGVVAGLVGTGLLLARRRAQRRREDALEATAH